MKNLIRSIIGVDENQTTRQLWLKKKLLNLKQGSIILDAGAGCGVLGLMMAQRFPKAEITCIEVDEKAADECYKNVSGELASAGAGTKGILDVPEERIWTSALATQPHQPIE